MRIFMLSLFSAIGWITFIVSMVVAFQLARALEDRELSHACSLFDCDRWAAEQPAGDVV